jgi:hypothetical protein
MTIYTTACPRCGAIYQQGQWSRPQPPQGQRTLPLRSPTAHIGLQILKAEPRRPVTLP